MSINAIIYFNRFFFLLHLCPNVFFPSRERGGTSVFSNTNCFPFNSRNAFIISLCRTWTRVMYFFKFRISSRWVPCTNLEMCLNWLYKVAIISIFPLGMMRWTIEKIYDCGMSLDGNLLRNTNIVKAKKIKRTREKWGGENERWLLKVYDSKTFYQLQ